MQDLAELDAYLRHCSLKDRERTVGKLAETIGQRFEQDRAAAAPLSQRRFDPCIHQPAVVDKYPTVRFDCNRYIVPRARAFQTVTVKGYVDRIEVVAEGHVVARHDRSYERGQQILDPTHYLVTLGRRPAALDHSNVYRQRHNCCCMGNAGTGKTHLAIALGLAVCHQGRRVRFFTAANLVTRLEEARKLLPTRSLPRPVGQGGLADL